jgi:hypothetical protein
MLLYSHIIEEDVLIVWRYSYLCVLLFPVKSTDNYLIVCAGDCSLSKLQDNV